MSGLMLCRMEFVKASCKLTETILDGHGLGLRVWETYIVLKPDEEILIWILGKVCALNPSPQHGVARTSYAVCCLHLLFGVG